MTTANAAFPVPPAAPPPFSRPSPVLRPVDHYLPLPSPLKLQEGQLLRGAHVAAARLGDPGDPPVVVLGALGSDRYPGIRPDGSPGWWHPQLGPGRPLDPGRVQLLSIDYLGSGASTRPAAGDGYLIAPVDQARAVLAVLDALAIDRALIVGLSYGGDVALALGELAPRRVSGLAVLGAADRATPSAAAWRALQREVVRQGIAAGDGARGVALARAMEILGATSPEELDRRFAGPAVVDGSEVWLPLSAHLAARGGAHAALTPPATQLALSQSRDLAQLRPERIRAPLWLLGASTDRVCPRGEIEALATRVPDLRACRIVDSAHGHEAYIHEDAAVAGFLAAVLAGDRTAAPERDDPDAAASRLVGGEA